LVLKGQLKKITDHFLMKPHIYYAVYLFAILLFLLFWYVFLNGQDKVVINVEFPYLFGLKFIL